MNSRFVSGRWHVHGQWKDFELLLTTLEQHARTGTKWRAKLRLGTEDVYLKGSPLAPWPALRHGVRRALLRRPEPRLAEFHNLAWLRAHGFRAPEPRLAGVRRSGGLARYQFLVTGFVAAPRLDEFWATELEERRAALATTLGHTLARLHGLGFVHRDLFARNLLVEDGPRWPEPVFLDAWRGGPGRGLRGPVHDLACLMLDGASLFSPAEQHRFFVAYGAENAAGRAPDFLAKVARARARLLVRERRRHPELAPEWKFLEPG